MKWLDRLLGRVPDHGMPERASLGQSALDREPTSDRYLIEVMAAVNPDTLRDYEPFPPTIQGIEGLTEIWYAMQRHGGESYEGFPEWGDQVTAARAHRMVLIAREMVAQKALHQDDL
jgi:hypothetical protein